MQTFAFAALDAVAAAVVGVIDVDAELVRATGSGSAGDLLHAIRRRRTEPNGSEAARIGRRPVSHRPNLNESGTASGLGGGEASTRCRRHL
jgi:hypothetical protein